MLTNGVISFSNSPLLASFNVPNIELCTQISISNTGITTLNLNVKTVAGSISIVNNPSLVSVSFPSLKTSGSIEFNAINGVTTPFNAPLLENIISQNNMAFPVDVIVALPSLKFIKIFSVSFPNGYVPPSLETVDGSMVVWTGSGTVSSLSLPNLKAVTGTLTIGRNILDFIQLPLLQIGGVSGTFSIRSLNLPSLGNYTYII